MKCNRPTVTSLLAASLLLLPSPTPSATTCVALPPLKPIHRIWGVVFFPNGDRIAKAKVTVLQADKEISVQETNSDGKFSFAHLKPGNYEIRVRVEGVRIAATTVVLVHPEARPKREIAVEIQLNACSSFSLVSPKKLKSGLNPHSSSPARPNEKS